MRALPWDAPYSIPSEVADELRRLEAEMPVDHLLCPGCSASASTPCLADCQPRGARGPRVRGAICAAGNGDPGRSDDDSRSGDVAC